MQEPIPKSFPDFRTCPVTRTHWPNTEGWLNSLLKKGQEPHRYCVVGRKVTIWQYGYPFLSLHVFFQWKLPNIKLKFGLSLSLKCSLETTSYRGWPVQKLLHCEWRHWSEESAPSKWSIGTSQGIFSQAGKPVTSSSQYFPWSTWFLKNILLTGDMAQCQNFGPECTQSWVWLPNTANQNLKTGKMYALVHS